MRTVWERKVHLSGGNRFFLGDEYCHIATIVEATGNCEYDDERSDAHPHLPDANEDVRV